MSQAGVPDNRRASHKFLSRPTTPLPFDLSIQLLLHAHAQWQCVVVVAGSQKDMGTHSGARSAESPR